MAKWEIYSDPDDDNSKLFECWLIDGNAPPAQVSAQHVFVG